MYKSATDLKENGYETETEAIRVRDQLNKELDDQRKQDPSYTGTLTNQNYTTGGTGSGSISNNPLNGTTAHKYASGGLVDYTGPAWVDGTPTRPEAFLDPNDTELIRAMIDSLSYIHLKTPTIMPDMSDYGNNNTIGDINITINQAELSSDADIDQLARRVGSAFTRELSHQGLNLANYSF